MPSNQFKIILLLLLFVVTESSAQQTTYSPYSRYGIGELSFGGYGSQLAMGGVGLAYVDSGHVNFLNPASYSAIKLTTFEVGARADFLRLSNNQFSENANTASFSYLALGFPLIEKKWGLSFGILPYSNKGYNIEQEIIDSVNIGNRSLIYEGSGGLNRIYIGTGIAINKYVSVGINGSYFFGNLKTNNRIEYPDSVNIINSRLIRTTTISDVAMSAGIIVNHNIGKNGKVSYGFNGSIGEDINAKNDILIENYTRTSGGFEFIKDTVLFEEDMEGELTFPVSLGAGIFLQLNDEWQFSSDFEVQNWSDFESFGIKDSLQNSFRFGFGSQFSPKNPNKGFWGNKAIYRAGFRYYRSYLELQNTAIEEYGITFGLALPVNFTKLRGSTAPPFNSDINLSFELGKRGTTDNSLIKEEFFRINIGLTLRDKWFNPVKYD